MGKILIFFITLVGDRSLSLVSWNAWVTRDLLESW